MGGEEIGIRWSFHPSRNLLGFNSLAPHTKMKNKNENLNSNNNRYLSIWNRTLGYNKLHKLQLFWKRSTITITKILSVLVSTLIIALLFKPIPSKAITTTGDLLYSNTPNVTSSFWGDNDNCTLNVCGRAFAYTPTQKQYICGFATEISYDTTGTDTNAQLTLGVYPTSPEVGTVIQSTSTTFGVLARSGTPANFYFRFPQCFTANTGSTYYFTLTTNTTSDRYLLSRINNGTSGWIKMGGWSNTASQLLDAEIYGYNYADTITYATSTAINVGGYSNTCSGQMFDTYGGIPWFASSTLTYVGCTMFNPASSTFGGQAAFNRSLSAFQGVFPFNIFFDFQTIVKNNTSGYNATNQTISVSFPSPTPGTFSFSSTTLNTYIGSSTNSYIRTTESYMIWLFLLFGIFGILGIL